MSENSQTLSWEEYGFALYCHEDIWTNKQHWSVSVSVYTFGDFVFPDNYKLVSSVYQIKCDEQFPATLKIQHCMNSSDQLIFAVSSDNEPPYNFKVMDGGCFVNNFGFLEVNKFSLFSIIWNWLFPTSIPRTILCNIYLSHSRQPKYYDNMNIWDLNFYAFKRLNALDRSFEKYIGKQKNFINSVRFTVEFERNAEWLNFQHCTSDPSLEFDEYSQLIITRNEIESYKEDLGHPPSCRMILKSKDLSCSSFSVPFRIIGAKPPLNMIKFIWPFWGK